MHYSEEFLRYGMEINALRFGDMELKSRRISPYFFDSGRWRLGTSITRLGKAYANLISESFPKLPDVIFGPAYKGIPISVAVAMALGDVGYAYNRKEAKDHGEGGIIIGEPLNGKNVIIVDDVMTTGDSCSEAIEIVRAQGGSPVGCVIAFDRQEKGINSDGKDTEFSAVQDFQQKYKIPVRAVATLDDLIALLQSDPTEASFTILQRILDYKKKYGA